MGLIDKIRNEEEGEDHVVTLFRDLINRNSTQWDLEDQIREAIYYEDLPKVMELKKEIDLSNMCRTGLINQLDGIFHGAYEDVEPEKDAEVLLETFGATMDRISVKLVKAEKKPEVAEEMEEEVKQLLILLSRNETKIAEGRLRNIQAPIQKFYGKRHIEDIEDFQVEDA